jgi:subtilisin family serine protease
MKREYIVVKREELPPERRFNSLTHIDEHRPVARTVLIADVVPLEDEEVEVVRALPHVESVAPNRRLENAATSQAYSIEFHNADLLHERNVRGKGVTVAVLENGVYTAGISARLSRNLVGFKDFSDTNPGDDHSLRVAGIVCRVAPDVSLIVANTTNESDLVEGLDWAVRSGVDIVNMSVGLPNTPSTSAISVAASNAYRNGVLAVSTAGNYGTHVTAPGNGAEVVCTGAVDYAGNPWAHSNRGPEVDIAAIGVDIEVMTAGGTGYDSGTSYAAPHVTGVAALLWPRVGSASGVRSALYGGTKLRHLDPNAVGRGVLRAAKRVRKVRKTAAPTRDPVLDFEDYGSEEFTNTGAMKDPGAYNVAHPPCAGGVA